MTPATVTPMVIVASALTAGEHVRQRLVGEDGESRRVVVLERGEECEAPDAPDLLRAQMEMKGFPRSDLAALLGSKARASEIPDRCRHLTLEQAWKLHTEWKLPTEALIRPYPLKTA